MKEHSFQGPSGFYVTDRCISEWDTCPLCTKENVNTYDIVLLSVQDLTPWTTKAGELVENTKRELAVKKNDLVAFQGLIDIHGSLRGLVLDMTRGTGDKESANGKPTFVQKLTDDEMLEMFGHPAKMSEKGTVIVPENDAVNPWNYEKYHSVPSRADLAREYNVGPRPGSIDEDAVQQNDEPVMLLDLSEALPDVD
jgi:hypothetical protein